MTDKVSDHLFECLLKGLTPEIYTELESDPEVIKLFHKIILRLIRNRLGNIDVDICDDLAHEVISNIKFTCK